MFTPHNYTKIPCSFLFGLFIHNHKFLLSPSPLDRGDRLLARGGPSTNFRFRFSFTISSSIPSTRINSMNSLESSVTQKDTRNKQ